MFRSHFVGILVVLWMIGLAMDDGIGTFIHLLYAAALAVLAVCLGPEMYHQPEAEAGLPTRQARHGDSDRRGRRKLKGPGIPKAATMSWTISAAIRMKTEGRRRPLTPARHPGESRGGVQ